MFERLRQYRFLFVLIAALVVVGRMGGLHAHIDVPASFEHDFGFEGLHHFDASIFDDHDAQHFDHGEDSVHIDVEMAAASNRADGISGLGFDAPLIVGFIFLLLAVPAQVRIRPVWRTPPSWPEPLHIRPLLRGPPLHP